MNFPYTFSIEVRDLVKKFRSYTSETSLLDRLRRNNFKELTVINGISFNVRKGEMIGILGQNGSGKTTLLRLIARTIPPDRGTIKTLGSIVPMLELGTGFDGEMTARDNIIIYGTILGLSHSEIKKKIDQILEFAELGDFADLKIKKFSSGMNARLAFSTVVQAKPEILLVDEILSVGDASFQEKSRKAFYSFIEEKKTIVYVTHNLGNLKKLCDRAVLLHEGKIGSIGEPEKVVDAYLDTLSYKKDTADNKTNGRGEDGNLQAMDIQGVRNMINRQEHANALPIIREMLNKEPRNGHLNYLYALCLQNLNIDYTRALYHYDIALECGFYEFWVLYGRGSLYYIMGEHEAAFLDLKKAASLNPSHEETQLMLKKLTNYS